MKKLLLTLSLATVYFATYAQNTFPTSGNVGIGTTGPGAPLSVINHTPVIQLFDLDANPEDASSEGKIAFGSALGEFASIESLRTGTAADDVTQLRFSTSYATGAGGDGDNIERMRLTPQGNLLINKTFQNNSSYKLDVAGNVRANQIVVNATGADFVFDSSYKLSSLSSLKKYIDQNHHLPEIASAKDMQANGLNVGDNQIKLLQKVEELTLYLIEKDNQLNDEKELADKQQGQIDTQNKQLKEEQAQNVSQETRLNGLEKQIEAMNLQMDKMAKQSSK
jgi:hypothetical protein